MVFRAIAFSVWINVKVWADRVVMTNNGPVQGITVSSGDPVIEGFLGIPYAEPPLGRLRFQKPVPKTPWSGVYDASSLPPTCFQNATVQYYYVPPLENMTEDCLYLNLWVPYSRKSTSLKPVLIYIHGGTFNAGSTNMKVYNGKTLSQRGDIIVATVNYRVGVLGFFTSLTEEAVGNVGIHDQILAIRWIKANAKSFGGDPDHIVMMGESAGAMTIAGFLASPLTKNLFKRAILQSGGGIQSMILDKNERILKTSQKVAKMVGCADDTLTLEDNPRIVVNCLKRLSAIQLTTVEGSLIQLNPVSFFPRVGDDFLPKAVIHLIQDGSFVDADLLVGVNEEEGNIFLTAALPQYFGVYGQNNVKSISKRLAKSMLTYMFKQTEQSNEEEIANFYANSVSNGSSDAYTKVLGQSLGDYMILCNTLFQAEFHSIRNPVYFYVLTRRPSSTVLAEWVGTTHFDEVQYTFGNPLFDNFTVEEEKLSNRTMDRWIAFIKTGNPNVPNEIQWPKFTMKNQEYLNIDDEESIRLRPDNYRCEFWRDRFEAKIDDTLVAKLEYRSGSQSAYQILPVTIAFFTILHALILKYF